MPHRRAPPRARIQAVSSVVVYTPVPALELGAELARWDGEMEGLIHSIRQKEGHVILMSTADNDAAMRGYVGWLRECGLQAKEYMHAGQGLASAAARGLQAEVSKAGLCRAYMANQHCKWGLDCRFRCHPPGQNPPG